MLAIQPALCCATRRQCEGAVDDKTEHSLRGQSPGASVIEWEWKAKHLLTDVFVLRDFVLLMLCTGGAATSLLMVMVLIFGDVDAMMRIAVFGLVATGGVGLLFLLDHGGHWGAISIWIPRRCAGRYLYHAVQFCQEGKFVGYCAGRIGAQPGYGWRWAFGAQ